MSNRFPAVTAKQVVKVLRKIDFELKRQSGSHAIYQRPRDKRRTVVPIHSTKALKRKTLKAILDDARLTMDEFTKLL